MKERLFIHRLHRTGDIAVPLLERFFRPTPGAQQLLERRREEIAEFRRAGGPRIGDALPVMPEIGEIERKGAILCQFDDLAHRLHVRRRPVRREAHHLVLVAVIGKAEILGQSLIEDAERVREIYPTLDRDVAFPTDTPCRAGEITETVDRDDSRFLERRNVKGRRQMREMVLDIVDRAAKAVSGECLGEELGNLLPLTSVSETAEHEADFRRTGRQICDLAHAVGAAVLVDRHMFDIGKAQPGFTQAVGNGLRGKPGPMLDPAKALLLGGCHQSAVPHQRGRGIAVKGIETQDDQLGFRKRGFWATRQIE